MSNLVHNKIAFIGKICSGKSHQSNLLCERYGFVRKSFGDKPKEICRDLFGMVGKDRKLIQTVAETLKTIDQNVWINYVVTSIISSTETNIVIDDCRFPNEYEALKNLGFYFIYINISKEDQLSNIKKTYKDDYDQHIKNLDHISESYIESLRQYCDIEINSGDILNI